MKFTCDRTALLQATETVARSAAPPKGSMPILTTILLRTTDQGRVELTATDLAIRTTVTVPAMISEPGAICVPSAAFVDAVSVMPRGTADLTAAFPAVTLRGGRRSMELSGLHADEFPHGDPVPTAWQRFDAAAVLGLIRETSHFMAEDKSASHLACIRFESGDGKLQAITTNGHGLAFSSRPADAEGIAVSIPSRLITEVEKALTGSDAAVIEFALSGTSVAFRVGGATILGKLAEGKFPEMWRQVIPASHSTTARATRLALIESVKAVAKVSTDRLHSVAADFRPGEIELISENPDRARGKDVVDAELEGGSVRIGLNARYVLESLAAIDDEDVLVELTEPLSPVVIRAAEAGAAFSVIMPTRL